MNKTLVIGFAVVGLALTGCGSDGDSASTDGGGTTEPANTPTDTDASSGPDLSDPQAAAAAATMQAAERNGVPLDEECVSDLANQLSDDDAIIIATEDTAPLSPDGEALGENLFDCADPEVLVDVFIQSLVDSGLDVDEDCARDALKDVDIPELVTTSQGGEPPADVVAALEACTTAPTATTEP